MSREVTRRVLVTLGLLLVYLLLRQIPCPGMAKVLALFGRESIFPADSLRLGGPGIADYLLASALVILCRFFFGRREAIEEETPALEWQTLILAGILVALQSAGTGLFLLNSGENGGFLLSPGLVALLIVTQVTAFYFTVWLARTISRHGIGNGLGWILLPGLLAHRPFPPGWLAALGSPATAEDRAVRLIGTAALVVIGPALGVAVLRARRSWRLVSPGGEREFRLPLLGVGVGGLVLAWSALMVVKAAASFLPRGSALADRILDPPAALYGLAYFLLAVLGVFFLTAWAWRPEGWNLVRAAGASPAGIESRRYDRRMVAATLPVALGLAAAGALATFLRLGPSHGLYSLDPVVILPIGAISLSHLFQFRLHREMARGTGAAKPGATCGQCGGGVDEPERSCPSCGILFQSEPCAAHPEAEAFGACVICGRRVCERCGRPDRNRCLCPDHVDVELIEGWATAEECWTSLEAGRRRDHLREAGIRSLVLRNTIDPIYGTLDLFALNGVIPFFAHRELGGGRIRLMVHARDWARARERLDQPMVGEGPSLPDRPLSSS